MSAHYTPRQWDLTNRVMDLVDDARQERAAAWSDSDAREVTDLVHATYQAQGIPVDTAVVDKAMAVALNAVPSTTAYSQAEPSPWDQAEAGVAACMNHSLMSNDDLAQLVRDCVAKAQRDDLRERRWTRLWAAGLSAAAMGALWGSIGPAEGAFALLLFILGLPMGLLSIFLGLATTFPEPTHVEQGELALAALDRGEYNNAALVNRVKQALPHLYLSNFITLRPLDGDAAKWESAAKAAEEDPRLFRTWGRWLSSDKPVRDSDLSLLRSAGDAVKEARAAATRQADEMAAQRGVRAHLLQHHGEPARREGP